MTQDPTPYDLLQDAAIEGLQDIVTPYYQPREGGEHSFPVVGQGINAEEYRLMSLAQGDGIIVTGQGDRSHTLTNLPGGASETNAQNQMILRVAQNTGRGEAILGGYYHVFYEDMRLNFPPVTTPTTYHVCITRDPRNEDQSNHLFIDVYAGTPPTTHNRTHIILHTVHREPNQLLTEATRQSYRQIVSPVITVSNASQLPDSTTVAHQTLGVVRNQAVDGELVAGTGGLYEARGLSGWHNLLQGEWKTLNYQYGWAGRDGRPVQARATPMGIQLRGALSGDNANFTFSAVAVLPAGLPALSRPFEFQPRVIPVNRVVNMEVTVAGVIRRTYSSHDTMSAIYLDGIIIPFD